MISTWLDNATPAMTSGERRPARDPVCTATVIAGLVTVAAIHWAQVVPTMKDDPYLGTAFVLLTLACIALAAWLFVSDRAVAWLSVGVVSGLTVVGYVFTRTVSSFLDDQDVGNWAEALGMVALLVESLLVLLSVYRLTGDRRRQPWSGGWRRPGNTVDLRSRPASDAVEAPAWQPGAARR